MIDFTDRVVLVTGAVDLSDPAACVALWERAVAWRGRVDVLISNAGIYEPASIDGPLEQWTAA